MIATSFRRSHGWGSASDSLYLAPEAVTNRGDRDSEQVSNFLPLVFGSSKHQNGGIFSLSCRTIFSKSRRAFTWRTQASSAVWFESSPDPPTNSRRLDLAA